MYLKKEHFENILTENGFDKKEFIPKRLSSGAIEFMNENTTIIIYQNTIVFNRFKNVVQLNTNGWQTVTSKKTKKILITDANIS